MGSRDSTPDVSPLSTPFGTPLGATQRDSEQEEGELSDDDLSIVRLLINFF
jgi:hypothetical protein